MHCTCEVSAPPPSTPLPMTSASKACLAWPALLNVAHLIHCMPLDERHSVFGRLPTTRCLGKLAVLAHRRYIKVLLCGAAMRELV